MAKPEPSLSAQAQAVERAAVNQCGYINALRPFVERGKRPRLELEIAERFYRDLEAAALTMHKLNVQHNKETEQAIARAMEGL